ncbi:gliding motility-associated C-terminal domain-containing protein [uncultured Winogradskyella sp.]|uniref:gliding motility-associated C-terminal domain-containing protein n=1 Tax=uncultured Winogradskyella sp. TaxID=395353 RepID=UPI00261944CA|nr:gliding motility-associated C-terminal domain-containing protein [uncultured Winogradskyella sp.]
MKISIKIWQIGWVLLFPCALIAQTANTGELAILPNTQFSTVGDFNNTGTFINDGEAFIYAHFTNNGTVDFASGGLTRFQGEAVQQLAGGNISYFYNVLFDNVSSPTASFEVSGDMSIANEADFNNGIVNNDDFGGAIIFEDNATHTQVFDGSHVDGPVQKIGDDSFEFPIGDKQFFRYAAISAPDNTNDTFSGKYFFENPVGQTINGETPTANAAGVITLLDTAEFWTITKDAGTSDVLLTLSWEEGSTTPQEIADNPLEEIHIARWDQAQGIWIDEGGIVNTVDKTVTTPLALDAYGIFTLARVNSGIIEEGDVVIYNGVTPNGDGKNDYFIIDGIENLANNNVQVFNRWGVKVFETSDYDRNGNVFRGFSDGRLTVAGSNLLPTATYFYVITYDAQVNGVTQRIKKAGYLYLTTD